MVSPIRLPSEPEVELPTVPSAEAWRAMTPEARLRFQVEVDAMLKARRLRDVLEGLYIEEAARCAELKARAARAEARATEAKAQTVKTRQDALLTIIELRGISCPDEARERILGCNEGATLQGWIVRAKTASVVEELFAP